MKRVAAFIIVAGLLSLLGVRLYQELSPAASNAGANSRRQQVSPLVGTAEVSPHSFVNELEVLGELRPKAVVEVMSKVSGRLEVVLADRGQIVKKGDRVAVVEDDELQKQILRATAALAVTSAGVKRAEATRENLELQVNRYRNLRNNGLISPQELEDLESRLRVSEADLELARATVAQAEASLSELEIQQSNAIIFSPLDGVVGVRYLDPGALVSPSVPILSILELERVKTIVPVTESVLYKIRVGLPAEIVVDAYPGRVYRGTVTRISPLLNPETRSADIEIETANPELALKPGMFARVRIDVAVTRNALSIPRSGLIMLGNRQGVYLMTEQQTVVFQPIQIGSIEGDFVEVRDGLDEGSVIVSAGAQNLNEGDRVRTE